MKFRQICAFGGMLLLCVNYPLIAQQQNPRSPAQLLSSASAAGQQDANQIISNRTEQNTWNLGVLASHLAANNGQLVNQNMGLWVAPADDALRAQLKLPAEQGLIVTSVDFHSSAAQAGIEQNDILLTLENATLAKPSDLEARLKAAGDKPVSLRLLRGGKTIAIQVQPRVYVGLGPVQPTVSAFWIGVSVSPIERALRAQLKLPEHEGLLATQVFKDSPAAKSEVKVHDILTKLAGKSLDSQEKLVEIVQASGGKSIALELIREGKIQTTEITPEPRKDGQASHAADEVVYYYQSQIVGPGAATISQPLPLADQQSELFFTKQSQAQAQPPAAEAGISKRLDVLDAEIKQLQKSIEALSKSLAGKK